MLSLIRLICAASNISRMMHNGKRASCAGPLNQDKADALALNILYTGDQFQIQSSLQSTILKPAAILKISTPMDRGTRSFICYGNPMWAPVGLSRSFAVPIT